MSKAMKVLHGDHKVFVQLLDLIDDEIETFRRAERTDYTLLEAILEYFQGYPDCTHHPAEDLVYKKLKQRAPEDCARIPDMDREHHRESERLRAFSRLVDLVLAEGEIERNKVIEAAEAFVRYMRRHVEMEEAKFFPAALEHLHDEDWAEIDRRLKEARCKAVAAGTALQFKDLRKEILRWRAELRKEQHKAS